GVLVHRPEVADVGEEVLPVDRLLAPAEERGDHVVRGHLLAVVELDALAELEGVGEPVLRDRGEALGQRRYRLVVVVERVEALVDVVREGLGDAGGGPVGVQRRRLAQVADAEDAALLLGVRIGGGAGHDERGDRRKGQSRQEPTRHTTPPEQGVRERAVDSSSGDSRGRSRRSEWNTGGQGAERANGTITPTGS